MKTIKPRVVLVEDDERIRSILIEALADANFDLTARGDLAGARVALELGTDLLLLDLGLPDGDGLQLCRELRAAGNRTPVIVLTARGEPAERVRGLEAGADDYLAKPFHLPELVARMQAVLRRVPAAPPRDKRLEWGPIWLDHTTRQAGVDETRLTLKKREFDLLEFFMCHPERVWTRLQLLENVWGPDYACELRAVDLNVARLRARLERSSEGKQRPRWLHTIWGVGYRLSEEG